MNQPLGEPLGDAGQASYSYAGFWIRLLADIIDSLVLTAVSWFPTYAMEALLENSRPLTTLEVQYVSMGWYFLFAFPYYVFGHTRYGTTLGKKLFNIYVVEFDGNLPRVTSDVATWKISLRKSIIRFFAYGLSYLILASGFLMVIVHPEKRGLHDLLSGSGSIRKKKSKHSGVTAGVSEVGVSLPLTMLFISLISAVVSSTRARAEMPNWGADELGPRETRGWHLQAGAGLAAASPGYIGGDFHFTALNRPFEDHALTVGPRLVGLLGSSEVSSRWAIGVGGEVALWFANAFAPGVSLDVLPLVREGGDSHSALLRVGTFLSSRLFRAQADAALSGRVGIQYSSLFHFEAVFGLLYQFSGVPNVSLGIVGN